MLHFLTKFFDSNEKQIEKIKPTVEKVNSLSEEYRCLSDKELQSKTIWFKERLSANIENFKDEEERDLRLKETLDEILPEAFAAVREAAKRTLGQFHFDAQIIAGIVLHQGKIAEQKTGEGKTLTATLPIYLNSLTGFGCHLVTPNDYLSRHGTGWMGRIYDKLGVSVGVIIHDQSFLYDLNFDNTEFLDEYSKHLRPVSRKEAYSADITYGTNNEFGFDYLRDNMVWNPSERVQREHNFAIVDEVDSILIDEARTPLIISAPAEDSTEKYYEIAKLVERLTPKTDYMIDEKLKTSVLTELGIAKLESLLKVENLYEKDFETVHHVEQALKAKALFQKNRDYVVKDNEVIIVDEFTGRMLPGRRYSDGLHQAIEAREGVTIQKESKTLATVSFQNYFRLYKKLAGMTGTAVTEAEEFYKIYKLEVVVIPTNRSMVREDQSDVIYKTATAKYRAVVAKIEDCYRRGQPVLVGTTSIEKNELLHEFLRRKNITHEVLNAKHHEREALIISQSGRKGAVTLATNMAGRGVDIILGGDPNASLSKEEWQIEHDEIVSLGGLLVIGTERHESRRIDNQLRGRAGRQGDPGSSRFYVSLQDDLMRIFGGETIENIMDRLGLDENTPIENSLVSRSIEQAQKRVEGHNFDIRKRLVEYDDVMNKQREVIYKIRARFLYACEKSAQGSLREEFTEWLTPRLNEEVRLSLTSAEEKFGEIWWDFIKQMSLQVIDMLWMEHLDTMEDLREGIGLRGYGGSDPLVEYKREGHKLFELLVGTIFTTLSERIIKSLEVPITPDLVDKQPVPREVVYRHQSPELGVAEEAAEVRTVQRVAKTVGRNDQCPCGSGKKYKKCHGR